MDDNLHPKAEKILMYPNSAADFDCLAEWRHNIVPWHSYLISSRLLWGHVSETVTAAESLTAVRTVQCEYEQPSIIFKVLKIMFVWLLDIE